MSSFLQEQSCIVHYRHVCPKAAMLWPSATKLSLSFKEWTAFPFWLFFLLLRVAARQTITVVFGAKARTAEFSHFTSEQMYLWVLNWLMHEHVLIVLSAVCFLVQSIVFYAQALGIHTSQQCKPGLWLWRQQKSALLLSLPAYCFQFLKWGAKLTLHTQFSCVPSFKKLIWRGQAWNSVVACLPGTLEAWSLISSTVSITKYNKGRKIHCKFSLDTTHGVFICIFVQMCAYGFFYH